jgi:hypothetical protein
LAGTGRGTPPRRIRPGCAPFAHSSGASWLPHTRSRGRRFT